MGSRDYFSTLSSDTVPPSFDLQKVVQSPMDHTRTRFPKPMRSVNPNRNALVCRSNSTAETDCEVRWLRSA